MDLFVRIAVIIAGVRTILLALACAALSSASPRFQRFDFCSHTLRAIGIPVAQMDMIQVNLSELNPGSTYTVVIMFADGTGQARKITPTRNTSMVWFPVAESRGLKVTISIIEGAHEDSL